MSQILCCDWLSERPLWRYLVRSGLPAVSHKKNFPKAILTKLVRSITHTHGQYSSCQLNFFVPQTRTNATNHSPPKSAFPLVVIDHLSLGHAENQALHSEVA